MRAIKIAPTQFAYSAETLAPQRRYCVPCALAVALDKYYEQVNMWLMRERARSGHKRGTFTNRIPMRWIGFEGLPTKGLTVNQFVQQADSNATYFIDVRGHSLALVKGIVYDTCGDSSMKKRIKNVWIRTQEITPSDFPTVDQITSTVKVKRNITKINSKGDKKQAVIHWIEHYAELGKQISITDLARLSNTSYIWAHRVTREYKQQAQRQN